MPIDPTHRVTATSLNFRSEPDSSRPSNKIAALPQGQLVEKVADNGDGWWRIAVELDGAECEGFVAARYLGALAEPVPEGPSEPTFPEGSIPEAHLSENRDSVTRHVESGRAHPLGEPGRPGRASADPATRAAELSAIFDWLDVEHSARYSPTTKSTYCNIYAHDVTYLAGVYLPRVWWTTDAVTRILNGEQVPVLYDKTVVELNANRLLAWLSEFGRAFGWRRTLDLGQVQDAANVGSIGVIVARNHDSNRSGHIAVADREGDDLQALRSDSVVTRPVMSQAGRSNRRRWLPTTPWWALSPHSAWAAWIHD